MAEMQDTTNFAQRLRQLYRSREDCFGVFYGAEPDKDDSSKSKLVRADYEDRSTTVEDFERHLSPGQYPKLGVCWLLLDKTVYGITIDADHAQEGDVERYALHLYGAQLPGHLSLTKSPPNFHHDIFFKEPIPVEEALELGHLIVKKMRLPENTEIFPKNPNSKSRQLWVTIPGWETGEIKLIVVSPGNEPPPRWTKTDEALNRMEASRLDHIQVQGLIAQLRLAVGRAADAEKKEAQQTRYQGGDIPDGERDDMLTSLAGSLRRRGMNVSQIIQHLGEANQILCKPPKDAADISRIAESIGQKPITEIPRAPLTEFGNALRLVERYGMDLRYCVQAKSWFFWNGKYWQKDDEERVIKLAKATVESIQAESLEMLKRGHVDEAKALSKFCFRSQTFGHVEHMLRLARAHLSLSTKQMDTDDFLLNVNNGTLDLREFTLREHRREDYITKIAPVDYDPAARAPLFEGFMETIHQGDEDVIAFLYRLMGVCLTGSIKDQIFVIFIGEGGNGKTTLIETMMALLGDYARPTEFRTLTHRANDDKVRNDVADLFGARMIKAVEAQEGSRLNEALIKELTGGDELLARFLFKEYFRFHPQFKIILVTNFKPVITGVSRAIWRRVVLVPFNVTITDVDLDFVQKLKRELSGILSLAVRGCQAWTQGGLRPPEKILAATNAYRDTQNKLKGWIESECNVTSPDAYDSARDLYESYRVWTRDAAEPTLDLKTFGGLLDQLGHTRLDVRKPVMGRKTTVRGGIVLTMIGRQNMDRALKEENEAVDIFNRAARLDPSVF